MFSNEKACFPYINTNSSIPITQSQRGTLLSKKIKIKGQNNIIHTEQNENPFIMKRSYNNKKKSKLNVMSINKKILNL